MEQQLIVDVITPQDFKRNGKKVCEARLRGPDGESDGESALTHWKLQGSNDEMNWEELETLHSKNDIQFSAPPPFYTGTWSVGGELGAYRYFRIFQTGRNSCHKYGIYLSGIELFGMLLYM